MKELLILCFFLLTQTVAAQNDELQRKKHVNVNKGLAIEGYDPVSYFDGNPIEGKRDIKILYKGITYAFASQANLNRFKSAPEKYEPAYGGWCAYAMGKSAEKVKIDPETYKIIDGKLYLFYNFWGTNTLDEWNKAEGQLKAKGDKNWEKIFR